MAAEKSTIIIVAVYDDEFMITEDIRSETKNLIQKLKQKFKAKKEGRLKNSFG